MCKLFLSADLTTSASAVKVQLLGHYRSPCGWDIGLVPISGNGSHFPFHVNGLCKTLFFIALFCGLLCFETGSHCITLAGLELII